MTFENLSHFQSRTTRFLQYHSGLCKSTKKKKSVLKHISLGNSLSISFSDKFELHLIQRKRFSTGLSGFFLKALVQHMK